MPEPTPGILTTEYKLARDNIAWGNATMIIGIVLTALSAALVAIQPQLEPGAAIWIGAAVTAIGAILKVLAGNSYGKGRAAIKEAVVFAETTAPPPTPPVALTDAEITGSQSAR